eukprot:5360267-Pyramimonas_sp.AAC.1
MFAGDVCPCRAPLAGRLHVRDQWGTGEQEYALFVTNGAAPAGGADDVERFPFGLPRFLLPRHPH